MKALNVEDITFSLFVQREKKDFEGALKNSTGKYIIYNII